MRKNWIAQYGTPVFQEGGMMPEGDPMEMEPGMDEEMGEEMGPGMEMEGGEADVEGMVQEFISALESGDEEAAKEIAMETLLAILEGGEDGNDMMDVPEGVKEMQYGEEMEEGMKGMMMSGGDSQNYMKGGYSREPYNEDPNKDGGKGMPGEMKKQQRGMKDGELNKSAAKKGKKMYRRGGNAPTPMTALQKFKSLSS